MASRYEIQGNVQGLLDAAPLGAPGTNLLTARSASVAVTGLPGMYAALTAVTGTAVDDTFTKTAHGLANADVVGLSAMTGGAGLSDEDSRLYFVISSTANTFQLSDAPAGVPVNFTSDVTTATVKKRPKLTLYTTEAGATTTANPLTADAATGKINAWIKAPDYDMTVSGSGVTTTTVKVRQSESGAHNVFSYGALGDGTTDDTAAVQAAVTACAATGGGIVHFSAATYKMTATLSVSTAVQITLQGESVAVNGMPLATKMLFSTDLGTGNYAIAPADASIPAGCLLENLYITSGSETLTMGVAPTAMYGINLHSNWKIRNCRVSGFYAAIVFLRDHNTVDSCYITNNYYSLYWGPSATSNGDHRVVNTEIESASKANVAVATDNFIDGVLFSSVHMGNAPFCFWKEGDPPTNTTFLYNSEFIDVAAEGWGNAIISSERGTVGAGAKVIACQFIGCDQGSSYNGTYALAGFGTVSDRVIVVDELTDCLFQGGAWHTSTAAHSTNGLLKVTNFRRNFFDYVAAVAGVPSSFNWGTGGGSNNRYRWWDSSVYLPSVASTAFMTLPLVLPDPNAVVYVTGTTGISDITPKWDAGTMVTLLFEGALTVTDGSNIRLNGNFDATADDTLTLVSDGTSWREVARSNN